MSKKNNQHGWTLLELLLAIALLALVAVIVYGSFRATVGAIERSATQSAPAREARVMLARLADELAAADWSEDREGTLFVGISDEIDGRPADRLQFTSRSHVWYPTQPPAVEQATIG
ncbi:MAG: prepilin-type N-terminal cleavage/methylation domain-containing protein, partial [Nitrospirota bacterium]